MTSNRPYLLRAIYEWILDNRATPHLLVDATRDGVHVPPGYVEDGKIVLNVVPGAVRGLEIGNEAVTFGARFGGVHCDVHVPVGAILAIYARENGEGLAFTPELPASGASAESSEPTGPTGAPDPDGGTGDGPGKGRRPRGPRLRIIK